ncbi:MAG: hypothetical protein ACKO3T_25395 [Planctomycetaceae bacterium]|jgi:hypothetical protein
MSEQMLKMVGTVLAGAAALGVLLLLLMVFRLAFRLTTNAVSQTIKALWQLVFGMATDVRFLNMLALIFCMVAERREGAFWPTIAAVVSAAAFLTAAFFTGVFLLLSSGRNLMRTDNTMLAALLHQLRLNVGFLGVIYLSLSFCCLTYSWHQLAHWEPALQGHFEIPGETASFETFFHFTAQEMLNSVPGPLAEHFNGQISEVTVPQHAVAVRYVCLFFRCAFWGAFASLLSALFLPGRVFAD